MYILYIMKQTELILLRKSLKWTQDDLARHLGVEQATVSRWENGAKIKGPALKLIQLLLQNTSSSEHEEHAA